MSFDKGKKAYFGLKKQQKDCVRRKIKQQIYIFNKTFSDSYGVVIKEASICLSADENENKNILLKEYEDIYPSVVDEISVEKALYIKDKYFFTYNDYNIIRNIFLAKVPCLYKIRKEKDQINSRFNFHKTNSDKVSFTSAKEKI